MKRQLTAIVLLLLLIVGAGQSAIAGDYPVAVIANTERSQPVALYQKPSTDAEFYGQLYTGVVVVVYEEEDGWSKVEAGQYKGYIQSEYLISCGLQSGYDEQVLSSVGSAARAAVVSGQKDGQHLNLRSQPSASSNHIGQYVNGTAVMVRGIFAKGEWYLVDVGSPETSGYMLAKYVTLIEGQEVSTDPVPTAIVAAQTSQYAVVNNQTAGAEQPVYTDMDDTSSVLIKLTNGETVECTSVINTWAQVTVAGGRNGYIPLKALRFDSATPDYVQLTSGRVVSETVGEHFVAMYEEPSFDSKQVALEDKEKARIVTILGKAGTWYWVNDDGKVGYYPANCLMVGTAAMPRVIALVTADRLSDRLNLRTKPSQDSKSLDRLFAGTQVEVLGIIGDDGGLGGSGWAKVRVGAQTGYLLNKFLRTISVGDPSSW